MQPSKRAKLFKIIILGKIAQMCLLVTMSIITKLHFFHIIIANREAIHVRVLFMHFSAFLGKSGDISGLVRNEDFTFEI